MKRFTEVMMEILLIVVLATAVMWGVGMAFSARPLQSIVAFLF